MAEGELSRTRRVDCGRARRGVCAKKADDVAGSIALGGLKENLDLGVRARRRMMRARKVRVGGVEVS